MSHIIEGRTIMITDSNGKLIDDIDTDMIFHNRYLAITEIEKMGQYAFDNLDGWQDFSSKVKKGDILIVGANFGSGSSRQQAVDCFKALGISAIIGKSFGAIYWRNGVNSGLPILKAPDLKEEKIKNNSQIRIDLKNGKINDLESEKEIIQALPFTGVQMDIYLAGGLFQFAKQ